MVLTLHHAIIIAVVLWFAMGWYLNDKLNRVHRRFDSIEEQLTGLREYLYEIDPQFDDERHLLGELEDSISDGKMSFAADRHMDLIREKKATGRRTLNTTFWMDTHANH